VGTAVTITRAKTPAVCRKFALMSKRQAAKRPVWHKGARKCFPAKLDTHAKKHHKHAKKHHRDAKKQDGHATTHHGHATTHHGHGLDWILRHHHHPLTRHVSGGAKLPNAQAIEAHSLVPTSSTGTAGASAPTTIWDAGFNIDPFTAQQLERFSTVSATLNQPPGFLIPIYKAAGRSYHIQWQILAAINAIETDYGRNLSVSPAGAIGWMQFMPGTWSQYGLAANGAPLPNPYDPRDAIFSAARYLDASGGAKQIRRALYAYNHAWWYVDAVLWRAQLITDQLLGKHARENGYSLPLDLRYMSQLGRTDDGVDIEGAPDGVAVYSITPGIVTAVASDPSGFGPDYPVILATRGPLAGQYIYYGHVAASLVRVGQHVLAGEPIAVMGHTGDAASLGHGHIEIGFSDASGDPLNHHGADAWTPSGDAMRRVLTTLTKAFVITSERDAHHRFLAAPAPRRLGPGYGLRSVLRALRDRPY
jgi:murein DD-endopeptidase MepM/ murein hydrolase activator NlpD